MCSPFILAKRDHLISSPFCKGNALLRVGFVARSFRIENHANRPFRVRFCDCEVSYSFVGNASTRSPPRLVQRQNSGRRRRGRTVSGGPEAADD